MCGFTVKLIQYYISEFYSLRRMQCLHDMTWWKKCVIGYAYYLQHISLAFFMMWLRQWWRIGILKISHLCFASSKEGFSPQSHKHKNEGDLFSFVLMLPVASMCKMSSWHRSQKLPMLLRDHRSTPFGWRKTFWRTKSSLLFLVCNINCKLSISLFCSRDWSFISREMFFRTWEMARRLNSQIQKPPQSWHFFCLNKQSEEGVFEVLPQQQSFLVWPWMTLEDNCKFGQASPEAQAALSKIVHVNYYHGTYNNAVR